MREGIYRRKVVSKARGGEAGFIHGCAGVDVWFITDWCVCKIVLHSSYIDGESAV